MKLYTTDFISGKEIKTIEMVKGMVVDNYIQYATKEAEIRMIESAMELQADAIINVRYGSSSLMQGAAEVIVYGTAVKYK